MTNGNSPKIASEIIDAILAYGDARADKDLVKGTASLKKSIELIRSALSVCADGGKDSSNARDAALKEAIKVLKDEITWRNGHGEYEFEKGLWSAIDELEELARRKK
jgi:hypothetical protein